MALLQSLLKSLNLVSSFILQVKILRYSNILHKKQTNKYYLWLYNFTVWTLEDNNPVLMYIYSRTIPESLLPSPKIWQ